MAMRRIFWGFCRNWFLLSPLHYLSGCSDIGFEFVEIFTFEKGLPAITDTGSRRLSVSVIRGVDDSQHHWYAESPTPRITDTESRLLNLKKNSLYRWYCELPTPSIVESESRQLRVSPIRIVDDFAYPWVGESTYRWYGESLFEKKISLASIFSILNGWSMPLKDQFGQELARDVIFYQNWII
jgi:hypothetical protein